MTSPPGSCGMTGYSEVSVVTEPLHVLRLGGQVNESYRDVTTATSPFPFTRHARSVEAPAHPWVAAACARARAWRSTASQQVGRYCITCQDGAKLKEPGNAGSTAPRLFGRNSQPA
jgi:hypothetical protein